MWIIGILVQCTNLILISPTSAYVRLLMSGLSIVESSLLADITYVLCLDTLGMGNTLNLHVSKPPREGTPGDNLFKVKLKN